MTDQTSNENGLLCSNDHFVQFLEIRSTIGVNCRYFHEGKLDRLLKYTEGSIMNHPIVTDIVSNDVVPPPDVNLVVSSNPTPITEKLQIVPSQTIPNNITTIYRFDIINLLEKAISHEFQIPANIPNVPGTVRILTKNKAFKHNFLGLCVYGNTSTTIHVG